MNARLELNERRIREKLQNDRFGLFVAKTWKKLIDPYTPKDSGMMQDTAKTRPWEIEYIAPYSAYQYYGEVYVDPVTGKSGFLTDEGWKSRKGIKKVPSGRELQYQKNNPYSTHHWDEAAEKAGQKNKLYRTLNSALSNGQY